MYINFQQNHVIRSVKTVHTNIFANNRKLHIIATTNSNFVKKKHVDFSHESSYNVHVYQFPVNWVVDQSKPCT